VRALCAPHEVRPRLSSPQVGLRHTVIGLRRARDGRRQVGQIYIASFVASLGSHQGFVHFWKHILFQQFGSFQGRLKFLVRVRVVQGQFDCGHVRSGPLIRGVPVRPGGFSFYCRKEGLGFELLRQTRSRGNPRVVDKEDRGLRRGSVRLSQASRELLAP
jgi:hypothetical protein